MKIYISSSIKEDIRDTVAVANEFGLNIEVGKFSESNILDRGLDSSIKQFKSAFDLLIGKISLHGVFYDLNPVSKDTKVKELSIYRYNQSFSIAQALNIDTIVFHTGYNGLVKSPPYHTKFVNDQINFWKKFIKKFEDAGITVALENTYEPTPEVILTIIENVNSEYLKSCIDTGHVNINSDLSVFDWITSMKSHLHHMHIHNNYGRYDEHNSLLQGSLDFKEILPFLAKNNLSPNLTIEVFKYEGAIESVKFIQDIFNLTRK